MNQMCGAAEHSILNGCMLGSLQSVSSSFHKNPWPVIVLDGFDLEENPRNLALLE